MIIIIIHLLGVAQAGYLAAPDNGPEGRLRGGACQEPIGCDGCHAVPFNAAELGVTRKPFRTIAFKEKDYDPGLGEGGLLGPHQSPFALNRSHIASLQLRSPSFVNV
jgi:hypothetical protein